MLKGIRLPNGEIRILESNLKDIKTGTVLSSDSDFYKYQTVYESNGSTSKTQCILLETING